jgi:dehydrogenase/reductase SDR family protein 7B
MTIAWVTGGGTGIGKALAKHLYLAGASVVITGRRKDVLDQTVAEITATPSAGHLLAIPGDASHQSHISDVAAQILHRWGPVTLLINNAGVNFNRKVSAVDVDEYQRSFEINCLAAVRATTAVLPDMIKANSGTIVNISSIYGKWASSRSASYSVGKYAVSGYTDALRQDLVGTRIHVMGVYPGFIQTAMTMPFVQAGTLKSRLGKTPEELCHAIFESLSRKKSELYYPWYVPWVLRLHRWMPTLADRLAQRVKR